MADELSSRTLGAWRSQAAERGSAPRETGSQNPAIERTGEGPAGRGGEKAEETGAVRWFGGEGRSRPDPLPSLLGILLQVFGRERIRLEAEGPQRGKVGDVGFEGGRPWVPTGTVATCSPAH